ncbi:phage portal protein [Streptomyces sp. NPDC057429]|uniref:phage portal protein n=1 Tax=Streptomyces sp. NPDC057429 TaxID=3346130 RepID=UPI0036781AB0
MGKTLIGSLTALARRTAVDTPVPFTSRGAERALPFMRPAGMEQQMRAMGSVGTLFSIVNRTSNATAQVDWKLWRKAKSGLKEDRVEVTSHAALDLWNKPNPFMPRQEFVETFQQHVDLVGEGWWVIAYHPGSTIPLELWPVRPDRMTPVPSQKSFLAGYVYTSPDGEQVPLGLNEVVFLRMPNPLDPYRGMGPVQSVLADLDATRYSAEWNRNFFLNSAEPGGIIEVPTPLSDPDFDQLRDRWNEQHRGVANAHRVAILEHGKWIDRKLSQRDMQFVELRSVSRAVLREAYGISAFALGEVTDINRATAEASKAWFADQLTVPRLERIKAALNFDLLPLFGATAQGLEFDYENPAPADPEAEAAQLTAKVNAATSLINAGLSSASVLSALGLPAIEASPAPVNARTNPAAPAGFANLAARLMGVPELTNADDDNALETVREQYDTALDALLTAWEPIAQAQINDLADAVETAVDDEDVTALAALTVSTADAEVVLSRALANMATTAAEQMASEAADQGVTAPVPAVAEPLSNRVGRLVAYGDELATIASATATILGDDMARQAAVEALRQYTPGAVGSRVAASVKTFLGGLKNRFRRDQLGGAMTRAQNLGRLAVVEETPARIYTATEKLDGATCEPCREIDGTEYTDVAVIRGLYAAGGYQKCEGGSRCRGTFTARWSKNTEQQGDGS